MIEKSAIANALRSSDVSERCRTLLELDRNAVDHDIFQLVCKIAREDASIEARLYAIRCLETFWPDPDVVRLIRMLAVDPEIQVADAAVGLLSRAGDAEARDALLDAYLKAPHFGFKWLVFEGLTTGWKFSDIQTLVLGYFVADSDEVIRASTVSYLGRQHDPTLAADLIQLLHDTDARVRANALEALGLMKDRVNRSVFERMLSDPNHRVQATAISILYELGTVSVLDQIDDLVKHRDEMFRATAAFIVRKLQSLPGRAQYIEELSHDASPAVQRQLKLA